MKMDSSAEQPLQGPPSPSMSPRHAELAQGVGSVAVGDTEAVQTTPAAEQEDQLGSQSSLPGARLVRRPHGTMLVYEPPPISKPEAVELKVRRATRSITDPEERREAEEILRPIFAAED
jgi:hypothetical protein